jgi:hypothetical protein
MRGHSVGPVLQSCGGIQTPRDRVEGRKQLGAELITFGEHAEETTLSVGRRPDEDDPPILIRSLPLDQTGFLRASAKLRYGVARLLKPLRKGGDAQLLTPVGCALDREQELKALRCQLPVAASVLAVAEKGPQTGPELRDLDDPCERDRLYA